jgi:hypothetical protein
MGQKMSPENLILEHTLKIAWGNIAIINILQEDKFVAN